MNGKVVGALLVFVILGIGSSCKRPVRVENVADQIRSFAVSRTPTLQNEPLIVTVSRPKGDRVCACIRVCSAGGKCTECSCSPPRCGSCVSAAEVAPVDSIFENRPDGRLP
jgi:hypothetical protein